MGMEQNNGHVKYVNHPGVDATDCPLRITVTTRV